MKSFTALLSGLLVLATCSDRAVVSAAPIPNVPPPPSIEGKYTLVSTTRMPAERTAGERGGGFARGTEWGGTASLALREATITRDTITFEGPRSSSPSAVHTMEYVLDPSTKPMAIDLTMTTARGNKTKHLGVVEITKDRLTIVYSPDGAARPKSVDEATGVTVQVYRKAPPPPHAEYRIVAMSVGKEAEAEKTLNQLAKDGYEVAFATTPAAPAAGCQAEPVVHFVLKRMVK